MSVIVSKRPNVLARKESRAFYLFILPWMLGFIIFTGGPIIASFILSFAHYEIVNPPVFIGWANYLKAFFGDRIFWLSLKVTFYYSAFAVPLGIMGSLLVAMLMNQKIKGVNWFRTLLYSPAVVSGVAVALLWMWIFQPDFGVLNYLLWALFRIQGPKWLYSETWVIPSFILISLWSIGGGMIIFLAGLQGIPTSLYESAEIDGAGSWQKFWKITLPMISPVIFFNLIIGIIGSFQVFTRAYVMTKGGPHYASTFYVLWLYRNAFEYFKMGYASALAWIFFIIVLSLTLLAFKSSPLWVYYEGTLKGK